MVRPRAEASLETATRGNPMTVSAASNARSLSGVTWTAMAGMFTAVLQILTITILVRLLAPDDFGLFGILLIIVGFAQVFADAGMSGAIIQRQEASAESLSSLYWLNVVTGVAIAAILVLASPVLAFIVDDSRLITLLPVAAIAFVAVPFGLQFQILLERDLAFRELALFEGLGAVSGAAVSIAAALLGAQIFALVLGQVVNALVRTALLCRSGLKKHRPGLHFRREDLSGYLRFGFFQMADKAVGYFGTRIDQVIVGATLGVTDLGYYVVATNLTISLVFRIKPVFTRVAFPVLASVQTEMKRLTDSYFVVVRALSFILSPMLLGLAAASPAFVAAVLGAKWEPAVDVLRLLAILALTKGIQPVGALLIAKGKPDISLYWSIFDLVVTIPAGLIGAWVGGLNGVGVGLIGVEIAHHVINLAILPSLIETPRFAYVRQCGRSIVAASLMALVVWRAGDLASLQAAPTLVLQVAVGIVVYGAIAAIFLKRDAIELWHMVPRRGREAAAA